MREGDAGRVRGEAGGEAGSRDGAATQKLERAGLGPLPFFTQGGPNVLETGGGQKQESEKKRGERLFVAAPEE